LRFQIKSENKGMENHPNPHMWIPNIDEEPYGEVCRLCGMWRNAITPETALPCHEPWPTLPELTEEEMGRVGKTLLKCRECGEVNTFHAWTFNANFCPECDSSHRAIKQKNKDRRLPTCMWIGETENAIQ
jgi:hypothetical protein